MVTLSDGATRASLIVGLLLGLSICGAAPTYAQDKPAPAASESATQNDEPTIQPEDAASEVPSPTDEAKPTAPPPEVAPSPSESSPPDSSTQASPTSESPTSEPSSSKDNESDVDSETYKKKGRARARASAALAGLVILGFAMVGLTWLGARLTRRYMFGPTGQPQPTKPTLMREDDWAGKPLAKRKPPHADEGQSTSS